MNTPELPSKAERHRRFGSGKPIPGISFISSFTVKCRNEESIHLHDAISR